MDRKVENAKITIEGEAVSYEIVSALIEEMGERSTPSTK
jgi:hypothetical protein